MSDAAIAGAVLGVGALILAGAIAATLRSGEIISRYGTSITRSAAPRRFWGAVIVFSLLDAVLALFAGFTCLHR